MFKKQSNKVAVALALFLVAILIGVPTAQAQFPENTITLIVPWSPGGSGDMTCRIVAAEMKKSLGQSVIVKNMPGAGSMVGAASMANSAPDGYTLGFLGISAVIAQYTSVSPVLMDRYTAVSGIINPELVLLVNNNSPWKTLQDYVAYAKANPKKIKNGNAGAGVIDHLYSTEFAKTADVELTQVPYKGWGPSLAALAGGHVDSMFVALGPAKALIKAGKLRPLAIAADQRHPNYPDIPTMKEGGVDITMPFWESICVPAGTPQQVIETLDQAIRKAFATPSVQNKIEASGLNVVYMGTEGIGKLRTESDKNIQQMIKDAGLGH